MKIHSYSTYNNLISSLPNNASFSGRVSNSLRCKIMRIVYFFKHCEWLNNQAIKNHLSSEKVWLLNAPQNSAVDKIKIAAFLNIAEKLKERGFDPLSGEERKKLMNFTKDQEEDLQDTSLSLPSKKKAEAINSQEKPTSQVKEDDLKPIAKESYQKVLGEALWPLGTPPKFELEKDWWNGYTKLVPINSGSEPVKWLFFSCKNDSESRIKKIIFSGCNDGKIEIGFYFDPSIGNRLRGFFESLGIPFNDYSTYGHYHTPNPSHVVTKKIFDVFEHFLPLEWQTFLEPLIERGSWKNGNS